MHRVILITSTALALVTSFVSGDYAYIYEWSLDSSSPRGVGVSHITGNVYVADSANHRVQYFKKDGEYLGEWDSSGPGEGGKFNEPSGVAVGPDGTVYVADMKNGLIQYFDPTGGYLGKWPAQEPYDVAVSPTGDKVYAVWTGGHRVNYYDPTNGNLLGHWDSSGPLEGGKFSYPRGIGVAPNGDVYVADTAHNRIQYFDPDGGYLGKWDSSGPGEGGVFNEPYDVAIASNGVVYVVEKGNHRIQYFDPTHTYLGQVGSYGVTLGDFNNPMGLDVAPDGNVYVADTWNARIQYFAPSQQWEYYVVDTRKGEHPNYVYTLAGMRAKLNDAGQVRWELVTSIQVGDLANPRLICVLKRGYFPPLQQWEYYVVDTRKGEPPDYVYTLDGMRAKLNEAGKVRWELVTPIQVGNAANPRIICILKSPKLPPYQEWEYYVLDTRKGEYPNYVYTLDGLRGKLNAVEKAGWELVATLQVGDLGNPRIICILKRFLPK